LPPKKKLRPLVLQASGARGKERISSCGATPCALHRRGIWKHGSLLRSF
jgi:hypothetical protein